MKKEILRFQEVSIYDSSVRRLEGISCSFLQGEITGLLGLTNSGKDLFIQLLSGELPADGCPAKIYLRGKQLYKMKELLDSVYIIRKINYKIEDLTIEEYGELLPDPKQKNISLLEALLWRMKSWGIEADGSCKLGELTELGKRALDFAKAIILKKSVLIIEDEFSDMREEDILRFKDILKQSIEEGMAVLVSSNSELIKSILSDKYIIFRKGKIVKKCRKSDIKDYQQLEAYFMGSSRNHLYKKENQENLTNESLLKKEYISGAALEELNILKGKVNALLVRDTKEALLESILSAIRKKSELYESRDKLVYIRDLGKKEGIFLRMSQEDNLLLPSLAKISGWEYLIHSRKIKKMIKAGFEQEKRGDSLGEDINELIRLSLERWYIYNPQLIILYEPFMECDPYGVALVKAYIKRFTERKSTVIIIKSREEYILDIADHIIEIL